MGTFIGCNESADGKSITTLLVKLEPGAALVNKVEKIVLLAAASFSFVPKMSPNH